MMSSDSQTPAEPDSTASATHPVDRRATLIVAIVAGALALVGSLVGSCGASSVADTQVQAAQTQADVEFRRTQRAEAYAATLNAIGALEDALTRRAESLDVDGFVDPGGRYEQIESDLEKEYDLYLDESAINYLIGSCVVRDSISTLSARFAAASESSDRASLYRMLVKRGSPINWDFPGKSARDMANEFNNDRTKASEAKQAFIDAARSDLIDAAPVEGGICPN